MIDIFNTLHFDESFLDQPVLNNLAGNIVTRMKNSSNQSAS